MFWRAFAVWLVLLVLAVLNGAARELVIDPWLGRQIGHIVSTILLCVLIFVVALLTISWIGPRTAKDALRIGLLWIVLTIAFEFLAGHYLFKVPWRTLLADYNLMQGRVWPLVLLTVLLSPMIALGVMRKRKQR